MKVHSEFARDFKNVGNEPMSRYHLEKAAAEQEMQDAEECGLFCTLIDVLLDADPDRDSVRSCRDPITSPPSLPPNC